MRLIIVTICCLAVGSSALAGELFERFFSSKTLRVDYFHTGTKGQEYFSLDEAIEEGD